MRTDAKIGFAIGAVLLAVLTVYAIVVPKHPRKTNGVALVTTPAQPSAQPTGADTPAPPMGAASDNPGTPAQPLPQKDPVKDTPPLVPPTIPPSGNMGGSDMPGGGSAINLTRPDDHKVLVDPLPPEVPGTSKPPKPNRVKPIPVDIADNSSSSDHYYTIQPGQTLSKIAYEVYGNARFYVAIQRENRGLDANHLKVGSRIKLPDITPLQPDVVVAPDDHATQVVDVVTPSRPTAPTHMVVLTDGHTYMVKSGDNLYAIARKLLGSGRKADELYALNKDVIGPDKTRLKLGMVLKLPEDARSSTAAPSRTVLAE